MKKEVIKYIKNNDRKNLWRGKPVTNLMKSLLLKMGEIFQDA